MAERTWWESIKAESGNVIDKLKAVIHEGNVRRVVVRQGSRTVAEFPLTAGVVGAVLAPGRGRRGQRRNIRGALSTRTRWRPETAAVDSRFGVSPDQRCELRRAVPARR